MTSALIPTIRYRDAPRAVDWLCATFGFEQQAVYPDEAGGIAHAQLVFGGGMVMIGSARDDPLGAHQGPADPSRPVNQSIYVLVPDADSLHARAKAGGARMVIDIRDEEYGGRGFVCRDPEGQLWAFGTYNPWPVGA